jgi:LuxR family transcriptional regulator, maltose regulon positive regulatory protein
MKGVYHSKIVPPRLKGAIPRERLFSLLDKLADQPVTWVFSPAGSGKTTLVASYLETRGIPALWYRVDEADADIATFFYYMAEAAKKLKRGRKRSLPFFTPEYRHGITTFTRNFFESLFSIMSSPGAIVFDNYQDVPETSEIHGVLRNGLKVVPEGLRVFVVSRKTFPPPFVSLQAESMIA